MLYSLHAATWQTIAMRSPGIALETSLYSLQLAKTHMQQWRPSAAKLDNTFWSLRGKKHKVTAFQHWTRSNPGLWTLIKRNWQALYSLLIYFKKHFPPRVQGGGSQAKQDPFWAKETEIKTWCLQLMRKDTSQEESINREDLKSIQDYSLYLHVCGLGSFRTPIRVWLLGRWELKVDTRYCTVIEKLRFQPSESGKNFPGNSGFLSWLIPQILSCWISEPTLDYGSCPKIKSKIEIKSQWQTIMVSLRD